MTESDKIVAAILSHASTERSSGIGGFLQTYFEALKTLAAAKPPSKRPTISEALTKKELLEMSHLSRKTAEHPGSLTRTERNRLVELVEMAASG